MIKPTAGVSGALAAATPVVPSQRPRDDAGRLVVAVAQSEQRASFSIGETVTARLVEPLSNRQWVAVVKGAALTLRLPAADTSAAGGAAGGPAQGEAAAPASPSDAGIARGAMLSLRVASLSPRLSFVLTAAAANPAAGAPTTVLLSDAARYLGSLLQAGETAAAPTPAASASASVPVPILPAEPSTAAALRAQALAQALRQSGLFYESHLRAWAEGRMPLEQLLAEPQAHAGPAMKEAGTEQRQAAAAELGRIVQRQLDALDGRGLVMSGPAWPGQSAQWTIEREADDSPGGSDIAEPEAWTTRLNLSLPRLGDLGAQLRISGKQVRLQFTTDQAATAALLEEHRARLAERLGQAGLQLSAWAVQDHDPEAPQA